MFRACIVSAASKKIRPSGRVFAVDWIRLRRRISGVRKEDREIDNTLSCVLASRIGISYRSLLLCRRLPKEHRDVCGGVYCGSLFVVVSFHLSLLLYSSKGVDVPLLDDSLTFSPSLLLNLHV